MDLKFTEEEQAFRAEVRAFLAENPPERLSEKVRLVKGLSKADMEEWHAILNSRGWLGIGQRNMAGRLERGAAPCF